MMVMIIIAEVGALFPKYKNTFFPCKVLSFDKCSPIRGARKKYLPIQSQGSKPCPQFELILGYQACLDNTELV